jgi:hypothetical protein
MYSDSAVTVALRMLDEGLSLSTVSRMTGVARSTLRGWRDRPRVQRAAGCFRCENAPTDEAAYARLLGYYLGDGCLSLVRGYFALRVSCDSNYPAIIEDVSTSITKLRLVQRVFYIRAPGVTVVQANWKHWPCLFPQHGPGRKHLRPIKLQPWQQEIVDSHPADLLRGLFHSDGSRTNNFATRVVAGERKRYDYPRWEFINSSDDILRICTAALDVLCLSWTRPRVNAISVARAHDVRRLDELIGPKA